MKVADVRVIIMCKAPVAGQVKTRLMRRFSAARAAELHSAMATTVIERAIRLFEDVEIAADDPGHAFFAAFGLPVKLQGEGDLGMRMQRQLNQAFADGVDAVLLLGTDSPHMPETRLLEAAGLLHECNVVLGPVEDGGDDFVALSAAHRIFEAVQWSTPQVLQQTLVNIDALKLSCRLLDTGFDVDHPADVDRAIRAGWEHISKLNKSGNAGL